MSPLVQISSARSIAAEHVVQVWQAGTLVSIELTTGQTIRETRDDNESAKDLYNMLCTLIDCARRDRRDIR